MRDVGARTFRPPFLDGHQLRPRFFDVQGAPEAERVIIANSREEIREHYDARRLDGSSSTRVPGRPFARSIRASLSPRPRPSQRKSRRARFVRRIGGTAVYPGVAVNDCVVVILPAERLTPFDVVALNPKPQPARVFGSSPGVATVLPASGRTDDPPLAKQDPKGASHACKVRLANHHVTLLVGFKLVGERSQCERIEAAVRVDQCEQRSLQGSASAAHKCCVLRDCFQNIALKPDAQTQSGNVVNATRAPQSRWRTRCCRTPGALFRPVVPL